MSIRRKLYRVWSVFWFVTVFLLLWPFFWLFLQHKKWYPRAHDMNRVWGIFVFFFTFLRWKVEYRFKPNPKKQYVFCSNHASYLDIPLLYLVIRTKFSFIGKSSLSKPPLFGYMYSRLHILVDRKSARSRVESLLRCEQAIDEGYSMAFFPEGTIPKNGLPLMSEFKDGAFKLAITKQVPVVPITIPYNWIILADDGKFLPRMHPCPAVMHEPIDTKGMTLGDLPRLKSACFDVIDKELRKWNARYIQEKQYIK